MHLPATMRQGLRAVEKSANRGVCGTRSLVCSLNVKAISSSKSPPFETGAILSKAGKLFRGKKNIALVAAKKMRRECRQPIERSLEEAI